MIADQNFASIPGKTSNIVIYYVATFGIAWAVWIPILLSAYGLINLHIPLSFALLAGLAPIGMGVWLTWRLRWLEQQPSRLNSHGYSTRYEAACSSHACFTPPTMPYGFQ